jgi:hypothetical protein
MEPIMNCPQGHTLNGKMCTIAPTLSCPMGYTLVNGMCQEDAGVQGFADSMNIPPTDSLNLQPSDTVMPPPSTSVAMIASPVPAPNILADVANRVISDIPIPQMPRISPIPVMRPVSSPSMMGMRPASPTRIAPVSSPSMMGMRPASPTRMAASPSVMGMRPASPGGNCPMGYTLNRMDNLCYPL